MSAIGAGVIGLGVGEQHVIKLQHHPACRVVAVADPDASRIKRLRKRYPELRGYAQPEALIDDPSVGFVVVASPDDMHHAQVVRAIRAGKHVFAEKPLCIEPEELSEIREALAANPGVRLSSNTILRMSPRFRRLRADIVAGEFGRLYYAEADYNYGRLHKLTDGWRGRIPNYSVMLGGGVHMVDLVLWLSGRRATEVYAIGNGVCSRGSAFTGSDLVVATIRFDDDMVAKVSANFGCVYPHFHRILIYGTRATFENGPDAATLYRSRDPAEEPERVTEAYPGVAKGDLLPSFVDAVLGHGSPEVEESDVFASMEVCFAIDQSLRLRAPVSLYNRAPTAGYGTHG